MRQMLPPRVVTALQHQQQVRQQQAPVPSSILQQLHLADVYSTAAWGILSPPPSVQPGNRNVSRTSSGKSGNSSNCQVPHSQPSMVQMGQLLTFQQSGAELAYRVAALRRWQSYLDVSLLCLMLLSVLGPVLHDRSSGSRLLDALALLLAQLLVLCTWHYKRKHKPHVYVMLREPLIALQRLVHVVAFVLELQLARQPCAIAPAVYGIASLVWQGALAQVRLCIHVPLQAVCCVAVTLATAKHDYRSTACWDGDALAGLVMNITLQLLVGFGLPTVLVYVIERQTRLAFLHGLE